MIPLKLVLRETKASYEVKKGGRKFDHLLFMHDLKLFSKNEDQIDSKYSKNCFRRHHNGVWVLKKWGADHKEWQSS